MNIKYTIASQKCGTCSHQTCTRKDRLTWFVFPVWCLCFIGSLNDSWKAVLTALVLFWMLSYMYRCYTRKHGERFNSSLQRWRSQTQSKENFSSVFKKQKTPLAQFKILLKKINGYILKPNQLIPSKNFDMSCSQLNAAISHQQSVYSLVKH